MKPKCIYALLWSRTEFGRRRLLLASLNRRQVRNYVSEIAPTRGGWFHLMSYEARTDMKVRT